MTGTATVQAANGVNVMATEQFRDRGSASGGHRPLCKLVRIKLCMTVDAGIGSPPLKNTNIGSVGQISSTLTKLLINIISICLQINLL